MSTDVVDSTGQPPEVPGPFGAPVPSGEAGPTLRADTLNLFDSTVVAVSSVAPAYTLAATMAVLFLTAGVGYAGPAIIWIAFVPCCSSPSPTSTSTGGIPTAARPTPGCPSWCTPYVGLVQRLGPGGHQRPLLRLGSHRGRPVHPPVVQRVGLDLGVDRQLGRDRRGRRRLLAGPHHVHLHLGHPLDHQLPVGAAHHRVRGGHRLLAVGDHQGGRQAPGRVDRLPLVLAQPGIASAGSPALSAGLVLGVFFFWGWDTATNLNEESKNSTKTPGHAGIIAMFLLLLVFAMNIIAAQMLLPESAWNAHQSTILLYFAQQAAGHWAGYVMLIAVLSSTVATTQTTLLPSARITLSMARDRVFPQVFGTIQGKLKTPMVGTLILAFALAARHRAGRATWARSTTCFSNLISEHRRAHRLLLRRDRGDLRLGLPQGGLPADQLLLHRDPAALRRGRRAAPGRRPR